MKLILSLLQQQPPIPRPRSRPCSLPCLLRTDYTCLSTRTSFARLTPSVGNIHLLQRISRPPWAPFEASPSPRGLPPRLPDQEGNSHSSGHHDVNWASPGGPASHPTRRACLSWDILGAARNAQCSEWGISCFFDCCFASVTLRRTREISHPLRDDDSKGSSVKLWSSKLDTFPGSHDQHNHHAGRASRVPIDSNFETSEAASPSRIRL